MRRELEESEDFVEPLGLATPVEIGSLSGREWIVTSTWAGFLVWAGWWLHGAVSPDCRIVMLLSVASRGCCSQLIGLGAVLSSLLRTDRVRLSWDELFGLPVGTEIHLLRDAKDVPAGKVRARGRLEEQEFIDGQAVRPVRLEKPRRYAGVKQLLFPRNLDALRPSLAPYVVGRSSPGYPDLMWFLEQLHPGFPRDWLFSRGLEMLIVTQRTQWLRQLDDLNVRVGTDSVADRDQVIPVRDLLFISGSSAQDRVRTAVVPPAGVRESSHAPVAVLDGPAAVDVWESLRADNLLFLLETCELDELAIQKLNRLSAFRDQHMPLGPGHIPTRTPPGIDLAVFSLERP